MATSIAAFAPGSASAANRYYCSILVQPYSSCSSYVSEYVTKDSYNEAYYTGSGDISVCEKITGFSYGVVSRYCNPASCNCNEADSGGVYIDLFDTQSFYVGDNWGYAHTINGYAAWNY
jgi:hypothetical protein